MVRPILIQGDSLTFPQEEYSYDQTWPYFLRENFDSRHIIDLSNGGKSTESLHSVEKRLNKRELEYYNPISIIVQLGIVDCAPRLFRKSEGKFIHNLHFNYVRRAILFMTNKMRTRSKKRSYVSLNNYRSNIKDYVLRAEKAGVQFVVLTKILPMGKKYGKKNPKAGEAIQAYNKALEDVASNFEICRTISPLADNYSDSKEIVDEFTINDGYHLNAAGHSQFFNRLSRKYQLKLDPNDSF